MSAQALKPCRGLVIKRNSQYEHLIFIARSNITTESAADMVHNNMHHNESEHSASLVAECIRTEKTMIIEDVNLINQVPSAVSLVQSQVQSVALVPLFQNNSLFGLMYLDS